jgi:hypothetical protein
MRSSNHLGNNTSCRVGGLANNPFFQNDALTTAMIFPKDGMKDSRHNNSDNNNSNNTNATTTVRDKTVDMLTENSEYKQHCR